MTTERQTPNWVSDQIANHLSKQVQTIMRKHLMKEYYKMHQKEEDAKLEAEKPPKVNPILPDQDLNMETELILTYQWGES